MILTEILKSEGKFMTKKYIFEKEGKIAESVFIDRGNKNILCISSMFGCPVKCNFCASGLNYFGKLTKNDILDTVYQIIENENVDNNKKLLISFMGSGEPLMNISSVSGSIRELSREFLNPYFAISFSGSRINNLSKLDDLNDLNLKLQFSLHSPYNYERKKLIPLTDDLYKILPLLSKSPFVLEINYTLIDGLNDSENHAEKLSELIKDNNFKLKINEYHEVGDNFKKSTNDQNFFEILKRNKVCYEFYSTDGVDIGAACGQLKTQKIK
mgnify:CR=1 FL=1